MLMIGMAVVGSAHSFDQAVAGMAVAGIGCGICDVNALAGYVANYFLAYIHGALVSGCTY
jgi:hypothetical protein